MITARGGHGTLRIAAVAAAACGVLACAATADAGLPAPAWVSAGVLSGAALFDAHLADYAWNVEPRAAWGAQALAGTGRFGAGVRVRQARTTQHIDFADTPNPAVHATTIDCVGQVRLFERFGLGLDANASAGRLHLGYAPDHVAVTPSGGSAIPVTLAAVDTWVTGGGLSLRHTIAGPWSASIGAETQVFSMDTAHRNGSTIDLRRERFSEWSATLELARVYSRR